ncbi:HupE/UreJ family protein [Solimonas marina]|uniref:HupE/UreJ family protein n=1 Tax=Solimonas marina TaxID=2714601 RepID=A0A969W9B0_9GAMM|nr:HupE/UreJ family protein [Solimonas marina]NKF22274.1 HupE/UreJ family protein [Solimonas marina]
MRRRPSAWVSWLCGAWLGALAWPASAHLLNMTRVQADIAADGTVDVSVSLDLTRETGGPRVYYRLSRAAAPLDDSTLRPMIEHLAAAIDLRVDGQPIRLAPVAVAMPQNREAEFLNPVNWPMTEVKLSGHLPEQPAGAPGQVIGRFDPSFAFEEPISLTLHTLADGRHMTRWLVAGQLGPKFPLQAPPPGAQRHDAGDAHAGLKTLLQYLRFGFLHILPQGLDHVLFVVGLYLGARNLRMLLLFVTSFTLAHSVTLILSSFGAVRVPSSIVEPAIAMSIAWIAIENIVFTRVHVWRAAVVFAFGLLHGLGFAAALRELGLPPQNFLGSLVSFNVGVELGQLTVVAIALLLTGWFRRRIWYRKLVIVPGSLVIAAIALVWTVQRIAF